MIIIIVVSKCIQAIVIKVDLTKYSAVMFYYILLPKPEGKVYTQKLTGDTNYQPYNTMDNVKKTKTPVFTLKSKYRT